MTLISVTVISKYFQGSFLIISFSILLRKSKLKIIITVVNIAISIIPTPTTKPKPATAQIDAAVVNPFTFTPVTIIVPAPKKPIPLMTYDGILAGSNRIKKGDDSIYSSNPYNERSIIKQELTPTRICVLNPAECLLISLSNPIKPDNTIANKSLMLIIKKSELKMPFMFLTFPL